MSFNRCLGLLLTLAAVGGGLAPDSIWARSETARIGPSADAMAQIMVNDDLYIGNLRRTFPEQFRKNIEFQQVEKDHPGFTDYVVAQIMLEAEQRLLGRLPTLKAQIATYLESAMTERDLGQVVTMMRSSVGRKALNLAQHANPAPLIDQIKRDGGRATTSSMQHGASAMLRDNVLGAMTLNEKLEFGRFMATPAGAHWGQAQNGLYQVSAQFVNGYLPVEQEEMKKDILAAAAAYRSEHQGGGQ